MESLRDCEECGEPISLKRLAVNPKARFCLICQSAYDRLEIGNPDALAVCAEDDGMVSCVEAGWREFPVGRRIAL